MRTDLQSCSGKWQALSPVVYRTFPWKRLVTAIGVTLLAHGIVYEAAPKTFALLARTVVSAEPVKVLPKERWEEIPDELLPEEFRRTPQFVPVNPEALPATPKTEDNFSAANQRAAQENPKPDSRERTPTNAGELENSRAVSEVVLPRELLPPELRNPAPVRNQPATPPETRVGESEKKQGVSVPVSTIGTVSSGESVAKKGESGEDAIPDPTPRPKIVPLPGLKSITMRSNSAVNEVGVCSLDAKYSEFGDYTQRMLEAIQATWYDAVKRTQLVQPPALVVVEFTLNADGTVTDAKIVYTSASAPATYACLDAVESRAPFDCWRADMVAFIGKNSETSRISFHYR